MTDDNTKALILYILMISKQYKNKKNINFIIQFLCQNELTGVILLIIFTCIRSQSAILHLGISVVSFVL